MKKAYKPTGIFMFVVGVAFLMHTLIFKTILADFGVMYLLFIVTSPLVYWGEELIIYIKKHLIIVNSIGFIVLLYILIQTIF